MIAVPDTSEIQWPSRRPRCSVVCGDPCDDPATYFDVWFSGKVRYFCTAHAKEWQAEWDRSPWRGFVYSYDPDDPRELRLAEFHPGFRPERLPRKVLRRQLAATESQPSDDGGSVA